jgi:hypothetical protein
VVGGNVVVVGATGTDAVVVGATGTDDVVVSSSEVVDVAARSEVSGTSLGVPQAAVTTRNTTDKANLPMADLLILH